MQSFVTALWWLRAAGGADIFLDESCDVSRVVDPSPPTADVNSPVTAWLGYSCETWLPTACWAHWVYKQPGNGSVLYYVLHYIQLYGHMYELFLLVNYGMLV